MTETFLLATDDGIVTCARNGAGMEVVRRSLEGRRATAIMAREGVALAGLRDGVVRSGDGASWEETDRGLDIRYVRWMAFHPEVSDSEFVGTEPAGIFHSHDGGDRWHGCPEVEELRDRFGWWLPYSPEAGCVRGFAFHGDRVYAAVEVGGVLRSDDAGESWRLAGGSSGRPVFEDPPDSMVHADVHSVTAHPSSADVVFAATSDGLFTSKDGGDTWTVSHRGSYCRAIWTDPADPAHLILGPADGVSKNGRIEESHDGGATWTLASDGLDLPWPDRMIERLVPIGDTLYAVTNDGRLFASAFGTLHWELMTPEVKGIRGIASWQ